jgi:glycosyltransferase involved in cell wall biosynthesis
VVQDGVTGVLLPPRPSPGVIADAILSVARDDRLRSTMRSASRLAAEGLTWSRCLAQREELLTRYARSSS